MTGPGAVVLLGAQCPSCGCIIPANSVHPAEHTVSGIEDRYPAGAPALTENKLSPSF